MFPLTRYERISFGVLGLFCAIVIGFTISVTLQTHSNLTMVEDLVRKSARVRGERINEWNAILNLPFEANE
jgi:hypothetical protein